MPDTILETITDACNEMGIIAPSSLANPSSDQDAQYAALTNKCAELIAHEPDTGWVNLQRLNLFNSVLGQAEYNLPDDYDRLTIDTVWDRSQLTPMQGPLSPALWQTIKSGLIGNGIYFTRYRVMRSSTSPKKVFVVDPPSTVNGAPLIFEYQSNHYFCNNGMTTTSKKLVADDDYFLCPDVGLTDLMHLCFKWRWRHEKGLECGTFLTEYNQELDKWVSRDRPQPGFSMTGPNYRQNFLGYVNIPDTNYGS